MHSRTRVIVEDIATILIGPTEKIWPWLLVWRRVGRNRSLLNNRILGALPSTIQELAAPDTEHIITRNGRSLFGGLRSKKSYRNNVRKLSQAVEQSPEYHYHHHRY